MLLPAVFPAKAAAFLLRWMFLVASGHFLVRCGVLAAGLLLVRVVHVDVQFPPALAQGGCAPVNALFELAVLSGVLNVGSSSPGFVVFSSVSTLLRRLGGVVLAISVSSLAPFHAEIPILPSIARPFPVEGDVCEVLLPILLFSLRYTHSFLILLFFLVRGEGVCLFSMYTWFGLFGLLCLVLLPWILFRRLMERFALRWSGGGSASFSERFATRHFEPVGVSGRLGFSFLAGVVDWPWASFL